MLSTIYFDPVVARSAVSIHAWESSGQVWDLEGLKQSDGTFQFQMDFGTAELSLIQFKFRFPLNGDEWEPDTLVRLLPPSPSGSWWTFGGSPRCTTDDITEGAPISQITVVAKTNKYQGGNIYLWKPGEERQGHSVLVNESSHDDSIGESIFHIPVVDWMASGFNFKLCKDKDFEPDQACRVWRPGDGNKIWIKSGQNIVRPAPLEMLTVQFKLLAPKTFLEVDYGDCQLTVEDATDEFSQLLQQKSEVEAYGPYQLLTFSMDLYLGGYYWLKTNREGDNCKRFIMAQPSLLLVEGDRKLFASTPPLTDVELVVHPNPLSIFGDEIRLRLGIGAQNPHDEVTASKQGDVWKVQTKVLADVGYWFDIAPTAGVTEGRPDGSFSGRRLFSTKQPITLETIDGIGGCAFSVGQFVDVPLDDRRKLLSAAFNPSYVTANVFDEWEMPHGVTTAGEKVWFVVKAPHAVRSRLLILKDQALQVGRNSTTLTTVEMSLTPDLRYWWISVPKEEAPHGTYYRFLFNDNQEVLDPAAKWVNDPGRLWAVSEEGLDGPWGLVVDRSRVDDIFKDSPWKTMGWEALIIYELHPLRFSMRNQTLQAFDRVKAELQPGGYLETLGVTALECLPVNEYPKIAGWGYDSSLYFAIESSYGGPEAFASLVRSAHDAGKAVLMDVVYNHVGNECPLHAIGKDIYFDGVTPWGDMIYFAHSAAKEFFRQAMLHLYCSYRLDGYRFDATRTIIEGDKYVDGCVISPGHGKGWEFLQFLSESIRKAATAKGDNWPYLVAENDPRNEDLTKTGGMAGQWHFDHHYALGEEAWGNDKSWDIDRQMNVPYQDMRPFFESVRYAESHDSTSGQEDWKKRIVVRAPFDTGYMMAKAMGAATILAKGVPMIFMGQEAGEDEPFYFGMDKLDDSSRYLHLDNYVRAGSDSEKIRSWFNNLIGLRNNYSNCLRGEDDQRTGRGFKTVSFSRGGGRFFIITTFGTTDTVQDLGWLGLPEGTPYKEIFNSSWPCFNVKCEPEHTNGGYDARLYSGQTVNLPPTGAVVLERA